MVASRMRATETHGSWPNSLLAVWDIVVDEVRASWSIDFGHTPAQSRCCDRSWPAETSPADPKRTLTLRHRA